MKLLSLIPTLLLAGVATAADVWSFKDGSVKIDGMEGKGGRWTFSPKSPLSSQITLTTNQYLTLSLTSLLNSAAAAPHQAHLLLSVPSTGSSSQIETSYPLIIKPSGKASLTLLPGDLPTLFLSADSIQGSLILGGFNATQPLETNVLTLKIVPEAGAPPIPAYTAPERFGAKKEIHHIFRGEQKMPNKIISIVFTLAVIGTLSVLFGSWLLLGGNVSQVGQALRKAPLAHVTFFGSLLAMEGVFAMYYLRWKLFTVLPIAGVIGVVGVVSGSKALSEVQVRRLEGKR